MRVACVIPSASTGILRQASPGVWTMARIGAAISSHMRNPTGSSRKEGFPQAHERLLPELKAWLEADRAPDTQPAEAIRRTLDIEGDILVDAGVAGIAGQNISYLYAILG